MRADFEFWVGKYMDKFFDGLERQKFVGNQCPSCKKVYLPPRKTCGDCSKKISFDANWIELGTTGVVINFTATPYTVNERRSKKGKKTTVIGLVRIEGSDTAMIYEIVDVEEKDVKIGMKVEPVWNKKLSGTPNDIKGFKPAGRGA